MKIFSFFVIGSDAVVDCRNPLFVDVKLIISSITRRDFSNGPSPVSSNVR